MSWGLTNILCQPGQFPHGISLPAPRAANGVQMPSHLRFAGLQRRTLRAYRLSVDRFLTYARIHRLPCKSQADLDNAINEFIKALYQEGDIALHMLVTCCQALSAFALGFGQASLLPASTSEIGNVFTALSVQSQLAGICYKPWVDFATRWDTLQLP